MIRYPLRDARPRWADFQHCRGQPNVQINCEQLLHACRGSCADLHDPCVFIIFRHCLVRSLHISCTKPMSTLAFALQLSELDESLERLDIRCNRFMKGSKRYKEGINTLSQSQNSFADFLEEFCGGTDEESMILGNKLFLMHCVSAGMLPVHARCCMHLTHHSTVVPSLLPVYPSAPSYSDSCHHAALHFALYWVSESWSAQPQLCIHSIFQSDVLRASP